jgi:hypothetical protein
MELRSNVMMMEISVMKDYIDISVNIFLVHAVPFSLLIITEMGF